MKKLLSTALAAVMATGSIVSANAAVVQENKSVQVLDSGVKLENNTLNVFTYNLSKNSLGGVSFYGKNTEKQYAVQYKDCIGKNTVISMPSSESYTRFVSANGGSTGNTYAGYSFANTGGEYVKPVSYTHLRAHETGRNLVCRLLLEKKKKRNKNNKKKKE